MSATWGDERPPVRLTSRGETLRAWLIIFGLIGAMWGASALGYWLTGVSG